MENNNMDVHFSSKSNEWQTPPELFLNLNKEFQFNLDAAATKENALCDKFFTQEDDALIQSWWEYESIYCNPPYGRAIGKFIKKAYNEGHKARAIALLIPARTDTRWWYDYCAKGEVRFIKGRLKFINKTFPSYNDEGTFKLSPAPFPSAIVIFGKDVTPSTSYITAKQLLEI